uniref:(northern house mosquito) hypothetical protein n=1 Tax=Culex pipiens TaxID=7175 RepID=A0A8D8CBH8_CULPI
MKLHLLTVLLATLGFATAARKCVIPKILQGTWFSWEFGEPTATTIDARSYERQGPTQGRVWTECVDSEKVGSNHTFILKGADCYSCVKAFPRTLNVFEKFETPCITLERNEQPTIERICRTLRKDQQLITLFNKNFHPMSCRSSLEGVWHFAYQVSGLIGACQLEFDWAIFCYRIASASPVSATVQTRVSSPARRPGRSF